LTRETLTGGEEAVMPATKRSEPTGKRKIHKVMKEFKEGDLKSSSGAEVKDRKQAVAIALSEARKEGADIPDKSASKS
jgi:hypothetical protein